MMQRISIEEEKAFRRFFGKRLLLARKAANLSQKGLAYYLRTGQDTISNYERGKVIPSMLTLYHIAEILAVNVSYFFPDERFANLSEEDQETLAWVPSLSPPACHFILGFSQHLLQSKLGNPYVKRGIDPLRLLERFIDGNLHSCNAQSKRLFLLLALGILLFEGLHPETMPHKNSALLQRICDEKYLLVSIISELARIHK